MKRRITGILAAVTAAAAVLSPVAASAQVPSSSDIQTQINGAISQANIDARNGAWVTRNNLHADLAVLGATGLPLQLAVDGAIDLVFPGLIQERIDADNAIARENAERAAREAAAAREAEERAAAARVDRGSCPASADVCVDIDGGRTWLQDNGAISYGPVPSSSGGIGQETPRGTFYINRKVKDEISYIFNNAPMPYAMYFTNNGHAFHQGNIARTSAGCVRLNEQDAIYYFNNVAIGDMVYIY